MLPGARVNFVVILSDGVVWLLTDGKEEFASLVTLLPTSPPVTSRKRPSHVKLIPQKEIKTEDFTKVDRHECLTCKSRSGERCCCHVVADGRHLIGCCRNLSPCHCEGIRHILITEKSVMKPLSEALIKQTLQQEQRAVLFSPLICLHNAERHSDLQVSDHVWARGHAKGQR